MGLETATYISGLNPSNPVDATDLVNEGDDHLRLIKSTLLNTFPNVTGAMILSQDELNAAAVTSDAATEFQGTVEATGFLGPSLLNAATAPVTIGFGLSPALITSPQGFFASAQVGQAALFELDTPGPQSATIHALNTEGGLALSTDGGNLQLATLDASGLNPQAALSAIRGGAISLFNNGVAALQTETDGMAAVGSATNAFSFVQTSTSARRGRIGFANTDTMHLRNITGTTVEITGLSGTNVQMAAFRANAQQSLNFAGGVAMQTTGRGLDVLDSDASGTPTIGLRLANTTSVGQVLATASQMIIRAGAGASMNLQDNNGTNVLNSTVGGPVSLLAAGVVCFSTYSATNRANLNTGGSVRDAGGTDRPIGFNIMPRNDVTVLNYVPVAADTGEKLRMREGSSMLLTGSTLPTDGVVVIYCNANISVTINAGTATLNWYSGSSVVTGSRTLSRGGVATLCRVSSTEFEIWGGGLS